eukprot:5574289-Lingulodinium_polyedra.AAC.1
MDLGLVVDLGQRRLHGLVDDGGRPRLVMLARRPLGVVVHMLHQRGLDGLLHDIGRGHLHCQDL